MAQPIYSRRFIALVGGGTGQTPYTVPDGYVAVVRDISLVATSPTSGSIAFATIGPTIFASWQGAVPAWAQYQWTGRQVAAAGEVIGLSVIEGGVYGAVSGYLLAD